MKRTTSGKLVEQDALKFRASERLASAQQLVCLVVSGLSMLDVGVDGLLSLGNLFWFLYAAEK